MIVHIKSTNPLTPKKLRKVSFKRFLMNLGTKKKEKGIREHTTISMAETRKEINW